MEGYVLKTFGIKALRQFIAETGFIIICCQATAGRCAIVGFADGPCIQVTCMLKNIEEFLNSCNYYRCHYSYLVNISYITRVDYDERRIAAIQKLFNIFEFACDLLCREQSANPTIAHLPAVAWQQIIIKPVSAINCRKRL